MVFSDAKNTSKSYASQKLNRVFIDLDAVTLLVLKASEIKQCSTLERYGRVRIEIKLCACVVIKSLVHVLAHS